MNKLFFEAGNIFFVNINFTNFLHALHNEQSEQKKVVGGEKHTKKYNQHLQMYILALIPPVLVICVDQGDNVGE